MAALKRRASPERIARLCAAERARYTLTGPDARGVFWFHDETRNGRGDYFAADRDRALVIRIAFDVLEQIGIEDAHDYDWHLFCDRNAEHMVEQIVARDLECRQAEQEFAPMRALTSALRTACRRRSA